MSDSRYTLDRVVAAPPETVLAAIRHAIPATGRSAVPSELRKRTVIGVSGRVRGDRFTVGMKQTSEGGSTGMVGQVVADEGGCRVRATVEDDRHGPAIALICFAIAAVFAMRGDGGSAWAAAFFGAVIGIVTGVRRASGAINHAEARFLIAWLEGVLDRVPETFPPPLHSDRIGTRSGAPVSTDASTGAAEP
jgi:hypothetical protein